MRMRSGGRESRLRHLGSFRTKKEADACVDWARMLLAQGRLPDRVAMLGLQDRQDSPSVARAVTAWLATRIDLSPSSRDTYGHLAKLIVEHPIGLQPLASVTPSMIQQLVASLSERRLARKTISITIGILAMVLDDAGVDQNPARHRSVRLPRESRPVIQPPALEHVLGALEHLAPHNAMTIALLEATGLRIAEACALRQVDVDRAKGRLRVRHGKGDKHRFAPCPVELAAALPEGNPVLGVTPDSIRNALQRACKSAGVPRFTPHDLRHRWITRLILRGVPVTQVAAWAGHKQPSMTTDVYGAVLCDVEEAWLHWWKLSHSRSTASTASRLT